MIQRVLLLSAILCVFFSKAQNFSGKIFLQDASALYLNKVYVTNLSSQNSVLSNFDGSFTIAAKTGDMVRFSSVNTERQDIKVSAEILSSDKNIVKLKMAVFSIEEVILKKFKPSGDIRKDINYFKDSQKNLEIAKVIGLPFPTKKDETILPPLASFGGGGLNFNLGTLYDIISGEREKKIRTYNYEKMTKTIAAIRQYYGQDYFTALKIPKNNIDNFLQFIYNSENVESAMASNGMEAMKFYIEKYLPVYLKRIDSAPHS